MLNIRFIRENRDLVIKSTKDKGYDVDIDRVIELGLIRNEKLKAREEIKKKQNELEANASKPPTEEEIGKLKEVKKKRERAHEEFREADNAEFVLRKLVPNVAADDVPVGTSEADNVVTKEWGEKPKFDFEPKNHYEIAESRGLIDKERATKVAGSRFAYIMGDLVKLQFAIIQFALDVLTDEKILEKIIDDAGLKGLSAKPFVPVLPPALANTGVYEATGRLNREEQTYKLADDDLWLNASAEHTLAPMYMREILAEDNLPLRYAGYTTAFRREAGTYGKDSEGILRLHQFDKLEMESFTLPEDGLNEHLFMVATQEYLMQQLGMPYRVLNKCRAEIGFPNARGVDIEVWLPGQNQYRETHTADFISDFQAEGTKTRVKTADGTVYVHNNDATAFAMGRTMVAIIENYQTKDGRVAIPKALQPFMNNQVEI